MAHNHDSMLRKRKQFEEEGAGAAVFAAGGAAGGDGDRAQERAYCELSVLELLQQPAARYGIAGFLPMDLLQQPQTASDGRGGGGSAAARVGRRKTRSMGAPDESQGSARPDLCLALLVLLHHLHKIALGAEFDNNNQERTLEKIEDAIICYINANVPCKEIARGCRSVRIRRALKTKRSVPRKDFFSFFCANNKEVVMQKNFQARKIWDYISELLQRANMNELTTFLHFLQTTPTLERVLAVNTEEAIETLKLRAVIFQLLWGAQVPSPRHF